MSKDNGKPIGVKGGVRKPRTPDQTWSYIIDIGVQDAQRCTDCRKRYWIGAKRLDSCPKCGGDLRDTIERRTIEKAGYALERDATFARADAVSRLGRGDYHPPENLTLATYLRDVWLPEIESDGLKSTTREGYARHVADHLIGPSSKPFILGTLQLTRVTLKSIREHYQTLAEGYLAEVERQGDTVIVSRRGLSKSSIRRVHAVLHRALNVAVERHLIDRNPAKGAARKLEGAKREGETVVQFWQPAELRRFLAFVHDAEGERSAYYSLWHFVAHTGVRRGEALGLKWSDVDLTPRSVRLPDGTTETIPGVFTVRRNRVPLKGGVVEETTTKTGKERTVDLDPETVAVLKRHRKVAQPAARLLAGRDWQDTGYVFTDAKGLPLEPGVVSWQFRVAIKAANADTAALQLSPLSVHGLRHTHATIALQAGIPVTVVSKRLGHASTTMTLNVYSHALRGAQAECAAVFASVVRRGAFLS